MQSNGCLVVCPTFHRAHMLMVQFMRQAGCREFHKARYFLKDMEKYPIHFVSEQFMYERIKAYKYDYVIYEEDFKEMWMIR